MNFNILRRLPCHAVPCRALPPFALGPRFSLFPFSFSAFWLLAPLLNFNSTLSVLLAAAAIYCLLFMFPLLFLLVFFSFFFYFYAFFSYFHFSCTAQAFGKQNSIPSCDSASNLAKTFNVLAVLWPYLFCLLASTASVVQAGW